MSQLKFENKILYIPFPQDMETESEEYNDFIVKTLDFWGRDGWEAYQVNGLMSGEKLRVYLKRRLSD